MIFGECITKETISGQSVVGLVLGKTLTPTNHPLATLVEVNVLPLILLFPSLGGGKNIMSV